MNQDGRPEVKTADAHQIRELERENRELRRSNKIMKTASALFAAELDLPQRKGLNLSISTGMCSGSSRSARSCRCPPPHYAAKSRPLSARAISDAVTAKKIRSVHAANYGFHRARTVHTQLWRDGENVTRHTVERLMRKHWLRINLSTEERASHDHRWSAGSSPG